jgi:hydrogenase maturation protease
MPNSESRIVVLGLGNMLMADDGVGLSALARLDEEWFVPRTVSMVDGGTWGMNLLPVIEQADRLLIFDAIDFGEPPGTVIRLERFDIPRFLSQKLSPHQVDLREVLALAELRGTLPEQIVALGIQPARIEMSTTLSQVVEAQLDELVRRGANELARWGVAVCRWNAVDDFTEGDGVYAPLRRSPSPVPVHA